MTSAIKLPTVSLPKIFFPNMNNFKTPPRITMPTIVPDSKIQGIPHDMTNYINGVIESRSICRINTLKTPGYVPGEHPYYPGELDEPDIYVEPLSLGEPIDIVEANEEKSIGEHIHNEYPSKISPVLESVMSPQYVPETLTLSQPVPFSSFASTIPESVQYRTTSEDTSSSVTEIPFASDDCKPNRPIRVKIRSVSESDDEKKHSNFIEDYRVVRTPKETVMRCEVPSFTAVREVAGSWLKNGVDRSSLTTKERIDMERIKITQRILEEEARTNKVLDAEARKNKALEENNKYLRNLNVEPEFVIKRDKKQNKYELFLPPRQMYYYGPPGSHGIILPKTNVRMNYVFPYNIVGQCIGETELYPLQYVRFRRDGRYTEEEKKFLRHMWVESGSSTRSEEYWTNLRRSWDSDTFRDIPYIREMSVNIEDWLDPESEMYKKMRRAPSSYVHMEDTVKTEADKKDREELLIVQKWIIENCDISDNMKIKTKTSVLYAEYDSKTENEIKITKQKFSKHIKETYKDRYDSNHSNYKGICLKNSNPTENSDSDMISEYDYKDDTSSVTSYQSNRSDMEDDIPSIEAWVKETYNLSDNNEITNVNELLENYKISDYYIPMSEKMFYKYMGQLYADRKKEKQITIIVDGKKSRKKIKGYRGFDLK